MVLPFETRFALMTDCEYQNGIMGRVVIIKRDITCFATGYNEFTHSRFY